jgi:hypothetical protein
LPAGWEETVRALAASHGAQEVRWWPAANGLDRLDFILDAPPRDVGALRTALQRALGHEVAIFLIDRIPHQAWDGFVWPTVVA